MPRALENSIPGSVSMKRRLFVVPAILAILLAAGAAVFAAEKHPFTIDDAAALHSASAVAVSPDGKTILCNVRFGGEKGPDELEWRLVTIDGRDNRKLDLPEHFEP